MPDSLTIIAGRCSIEFTDRHDRTETVGDVLVVCKPDNTVLVHDATGYQPVAWLTRSEALAVADERVDATDGGRRLAIDIRDEYRRASVDVQPAGHPVGTCPTCAAPLVRTGGAIACLDCSSQYTVPGDAALSDSDCEACGLPRITVRRGHPLTVCLDRGCESIEEHVNEALDRQWPCPNCGADLRVRRRGGLILDCDSYPDCETAFPIPTGVVSEPCECGLPIFETPSGHRCLDAECIAV